MKQIRIEKVTLNMGTGTNQEALKRGMKLIKQLTGVEPIKTTSKKRIPSWGVRPGLPIGCKITLRGKNASDVLEKTLKARENTLNGSCFDDGGNVSFGIKEHIDIPGMVYDPKIGIMGLQVTATLDRPGYRIKKRKIQRKKVGARHVVKREDCIAFFKENFNVTVVE